MPIEVNNADMNLPTLAGYALAMTKGHDLPETLYVYGLADGRDYEFYIDTKLPNGEDIVRFLRNKGVSCALGVQGSPVMRPAVGIVKDVREHRVEYATRICVFILLAMHGVIELGQPLEFGL